MAEAPQVYRLVSVYAYHGNRPLCRLPSPNSVCLALALTLCQIGNDPFERGGIAFDVKLRAIEATGHSGETSKGSF
ncbi:MAG: hypothetical protein KGM99_02145 [Burkholderiales bacterium]|nr:hypothetical protein [Burkholderiales bacterium]